MTTPELAAERILDLAAEALPHYAGQYDAADPHVWHRVEAVIAKAAAEAAAAVLAEVREWAIQWGRWSPQCRLCMFAWQVGEPERHDPTGCPASPLAGQAGAEEAR